MMRYAFVNADNIVVNVIVGDLNEEQRPRFFAVQQAIFGATQMVELADNQGAWIGGTYTDGQFAAPEPPPQPEPEPEPEPEVIEGTSEESLTSEVPDDSIPS
jgi:hypothetical protein